MRKVVRLTESDLVRIVKRVINEESSLKPSLLGSCKSGDCIDLFDYVMNNFGWDKHYQLKYYGEGKVNTYVGKNSKGERIVIRIPNKKSTTLDFTVHGKPMSYPLFDILKQGLEFENGDCSVKPGYELCEYLG